VRRSAQRVTITFAASAPSTANATHDAEGGGGCGWPRQNAPAEDNVTIPTAVLTATIHRRLLRTSANRCAPGLG
jgi:hypothetical protein